MNTRDLIYVGIRGSVVALNRATGAQVWATHLKGSDFVNVVLDEDRLLAITHGEIFCLDPVQGNSLWHNPLKGFGLGLATLATEKPCPEAPPMPALAESRRQQEAQAAAM
jgi:outer membrane protein assembly factor BamB